VNVIGSPIPVGDPCSGPAPERAAPDWTNIAFMASAHAVALLALVYLIAVRCSPWTVGYSVITRGSMLILGLKLHHGCKRHQVFAMDSRSASSLPVKGKRHL
jgi:hypothetical protein